MPRFVIARVGTRILEIEADDLASALAEAPNREFGSEVDYQYVDGDRGAIQISPADLCDALATLYDVAGQEVNELTEDSVSTAKETVLPLIDVLRQTASTLPLVKQLRANEAIVSTVKAQHTEGEPDENVKYVAEVTFLCSGHVNQTIEIDAKHKQAGEPWPECLIEALNNNSILTTVQEGGKVCHLDDGQLTRIGRVVSSEVCCEYSEFETL